ncbi:MAG: DNA polymerase I, partial [Fibrobacter sp.]|nr:DNA polymerase I [Fibrobacter sp.]
MPDDLKCQIPLIRELIDVLNVPVIIQDGYEADDLIGIITKKAREENFEVFLVTRDKDLMQLVGQGVTMLAPEGTGTLEKIGVNEVIQKMGVAPEKIVDYLALIGDTADNIPGVPGIGPKTAQKILETGECVEKILANPEILQAPKLIQKIEQNRENLILSKTLATLKTETDIPVCINDFVCKPIDKEKSIEFFRRLDFSSLIKNPLLGGAPKFETAFSVVSTEEKLNELIEGINKKGLFAIDIQADNTLARGAKIIGISVALDDAEGAYIPFCHDGFCGLECEYVISKLKEVLDSSQIRKIGHNLKYIYQVLKNYGINLQGIWFDTTIAAYLIDSAKRNYELDVLALQWLKREITPLSKLVGTKDPVPFSTVFAETAAAYSSEIVCAVFALKNVLEPQLEKFNCSELFKTIEMPLVAVLGDLEWNGILVDMGLLKSLSNTYGAECEQLKKEIFEIAGEEFNLNSPKQIGSVLFDKLNLPGAKKTKTGNMSTGVEVLEKLSGKYEIVRKILEYRESQKLLSTYIDALPEQVFAGTNRVHTTFNQTVTVTGRLSSTNPNLQNIPIRTESGRRIREAFIAGENNVLIAADYSQIELRVLAHLSGDKFLIDAFLKDEDIHTLTASSIYGVFPEMVTSEMRRAAKTINFGLMYGMGPINLARQLNISFNEARMFIETYFLQFPTIKNYMESV